MWVRARAPGKNKMILAVEHTVVHGSAAVVASIDLQTYISLSSFGFTSLKVGDGSKIRIWEDVVLGSESISSLFVRLYKLSRVHKSLLSIDQISLCIGSSSLVDNDDTLNLQLKDMTVEFLWPIGRIKEALPELGGCVALSPRSCSSDTIKSIAGLVEVQNIPEAKVGLAAGVRAFLLL
ncbi:hypothetical protein LguiA_026216 [Lonicera macranthoides]